MPFIPSEYCTPENQQWMKDTSFVWSNAFNGFPLGPNPELVGDAQPTGTRCVVNKDFYFMDIEYAKGMEGQLLALHTDKDGKNWARIIVEGVTTDNHIKTGFTWVEGANIEGTSSPAGDALIEANSCVA
jgi:hypothetical protein